MLANTLADRDILVKLNEEFLKVHAGRAATLSRAEIEKAMGRLAAKTLAYKALQIRRKKID